MLVFENGKIIGYWGRNDIPVIGIETFDYCNLSEEKIQNNVYVILDDDMKVVSGGYVIGVLIKNSGRIINIPKSDKRYTPPAIVQEGFLKNDFPQMELRDFNFDEVYEPLEEQ